MTTKKKNSLLIRLPENVMQALRTDADRCRRSNTKHVEAVLVAYLGIDSVELKDVRAKGVLDEMAEMIRTDEPEEAVG